MKVFIDTNILIDIGARVDAYPDSFKLVNELLGSSMFSLWVSAISINNIEYIVPKLNSKEKSLALLNLIRDEFSIIPFRKSNFIRAMEYDNADFEDAIQIASAEQLNVDCIVTRNGSDFKNCKMPVLTPTEFLEKWNSGNLIDSTTTIPFLDLKAQHHQIYNEIDDRMTDIIANTGFILGKYVEEFEKGFAKLQGAKYCIGVSSGTDALHVALLALDIGPGDEVIVPVNTFIATAEAVSLCGAAPVFVDCDEYYNMDVVKVEEVLRQRAGRAEGEKVRRGEGETGRRGQEQKVRRGEDRKSRNGITAIIPVHLYGQPANMDAIMDLAEEFDLKVVEDCCQAHMAKLHGNKLGNFGHFGAFSFYPGKNLGAYGEAGALNTNDEELFNKAKMIRQHGEIQRYHHKHVGHNYRMSAFQGAVLGVKLKYIEEWTHKRQKCVQIYNKLLEDVEGVKTPGEIEDASCVYHLYVIQADDRDGLQQYLQENGVASGLHYPVPLHLQEAYRELGYRKGDFPIAEEAAEKILSLPMYPELTEEQIVYVCDVIKGWEEMKVRKKVRRLGTEKEGEKVRRWGTKKEGEKIRR